MAGGATREEYAYPADPNRMPIPLYGEQVLCIQQPDGQSTKRGQNKWYYTQVVNTHGNVNNSILPFLQDAGVGEVTYAPTPIIKTGAGKKPKQLSFKEQDIVYIQPFQGDTNHPDRFGSILRFSSTHTPAETLYYKKKPFWTGAKKGDPFISLTCGVKDARTGRSIDKYYAIEAPDDDASFIYLTSTQKFNKFKLAQKKVGAKVDSLKAYAKSQVIIGSDRLIFNARKDEIVLVAKKDVKVVTLKWQADMDEFFTQMDTLIKTLIAQADGSKPFSTPAGPTGPNAALGDLKKIEQAIKKMKQK